MEMSFEKNGFETLQADGEPDAAGDGHTYEEHIMNGHADLTLRKENGCMRILTISIILCLCALVGALIWIAIQQSQISYLQTKMDNLQSVIDSIEGSANASAIFETELDPPAPETTSQPTATTELEPVIRHSHNAKGEWEHPELEADWTSTMDEFEHNDFDAVIRYHDFTLVHFYWIGCIHCRRPFDQTWIEAERIADDTVYRDKAGAEVVAKLLRVNCVSFRELCTRVGVSVYPTVRMYTRDGTFTEYRGERTVKSILEFLHEFISSKAITTLELESSTPGTTSQPTATSAPTQLESTNATSDSNRSRLLVIPYQANDTVFDRVNANWLVLVDDELHMIDAATHNSTTVQLPSSGDLVSIHPRNPNKQLPKVAVAHGSAVTFYDFNTGLMNTTNVAVTTVTSIVYAGDGFAYLFPADGQWTSIYQVSASTWHQCHHGRSFNQIYQETFARMNPAHDTWIYGMTDRSSPRDLKKFVVNGSTIDCMVTYGDSPYHGDYYMGLPFWFSYDGSVVFMRTGLVLHTTGDNKDMTVAATFTDVYGHISCSYSYSSPDYACVNDFKWITQLKYSPFTVYGLKRMNATHHTVWTYSWPYLSPLQVVLEIGPSFELDGEVYEWDAFYSMEFADDDRSTLYIAGSVRKGAVPNTAFWTHELH